MMFRNAQKKQIAAIGVDDAFSGAMADELEKMGHWQVVRISSQHILPKGVSAVDGTLTHDGKKIFSFADAGALPGAHNAQNIAASYVVCSAMGIEDAAILKGVLSYPGLPHRQQLVRTIGNVRFINDSKATNADATSKALGCYNDMYWIVGGKAKDGGLDGLESYMPRIKHAFLIGCSSDAFAQWFERKASYTKCGTLERAVEKAATMAAGVNGVVLLSPACASYDQFKNYEQRGAEFMRLVNALPALKVA